MISHLHVENIAVVKNADLYFSPGFNVLTGETGAGKSVVMSAINIIFGSRVSRDMIREGCNKLVVSAVINGINDDKIKFINALGYDCEENTLLIHREFLESGRNVCKINGRPATVSILKQIGKEIIDVYSQHEGYKLLSSDNHIKYIDAFGNLEFELKEYKNIYNKMIELKKEIDDANLNESDVERKVALLKYEINEIENAKICEGEIDRLNDIKNKACNMQKIMSLINEAKTLLNGNDRGYCGVVCDIQKSCELLGQASEYVKEIEPIYERLQSAFYEVSECLNDLIPIADDLDYNPSELELAQERLDILYKLSIKYGKTESDILSFLEKSKKELFDIENREINLANLENEFNEIVLKVKEMGERISRKRKEASILFAKKVQEELKGLDMPNVCFEVRQEKVDFYLKGCDRIQFFISVNEGDSLKPMVNVASGGELSRIMLAIKNVALDEAGGTIIFDEVDTGVSGSAANKIGIKLKELSKHSQVMCITHLAQIASLADEHFLINKSTKDGHTQSIVNKLDFNGRKNELARIISGINISDASLKAAEEMLNQK